MRALPRPEDVTDDSEVPGLEEPEDPITGPKAADIELFADDDADEVVSVPAPRAASPELLRPSRPNRMLITELSDDDDDDEVPEEIVSQHQKRQNWLTLDVRAGN